MLLFAFLRGGFSIHCHSANKEGVPVPSRPLVAQGQNNRRLARCKAHFDLCRVDLEFRMLRASLLARLPVYCPAECVTSKNTSLFAIFFEEFGQCPSPLSLLNHSAFALFAQRTRIPTSARSIGFCAIWVCISSCFSQWPPPLQVGSPFLSSTFYLSTF